VHSADFQALLAVPARQRSAHFALHHLPGGPLATRPRMADTVQSVLSTSGSPLNPASVDNLSSPVWLGLVVPKRYARRAVTRNLIKRQGRAAFASHADALPPGRWLLRLRQPFPVQQFVSAASLPLAQAVRGELQQLLARAAAVGGAPSVGTRR
jgi:ribonuclease P protein component